MQVVASEINLSETAFACETKPGEYGLRWFTPACEVKLCGHATLATAHVLFNELNIDAETVTFDTLSGKLRVQKHSDGIMMDFPSQDTFSDFNDEALAACFPGMKLLDCKKATDDIIVRTESAEMVRKYQPKLQQLSEIPCRGVILTAEDESKEHDFVSRFFGPKVGVPEDPVTGSAHCKLTPYWAELLGKTKLLAYQASSRGGRLSLELKEDRVKIVGAAVTVSESTLRVLP